MTLLTEEQRLKMLENGRNRGEDRAPVVHLFMENTDFICLLSEMDEDKDHVFGIFDEGVGKPELRARSLKEVEQTAKDKGLNLINDPFFKPQHPMSVYARAARKDKGITLCPYQLEMARIK